MLLASISLRLKQRMPQIQLFLLHTLTYTSTLIVIRTRLYYEKRVYFNFPIVNFPFIVSNIAASHAYGVYISQLIRYSRTCGSYHDSLDRELLLTRKLLNQGFLVVEVYLICRNHNPVYSTFMTYHRICNKSNTADTTCGTGTAYPSGAPEFTSGFKLGSCCLIFSLLCNDLYNNVCLICHCIACPLIYGFWLPHFLIFKLFHFHLQPLDINKGSIINIQNHLPFYGMWSSIAQQLSTSLQDVIFYPLTTIILFTECEVISLNNY